MNVRILHGIEGAKAARGLAVIIDVFRAFTLECYMFKAGAARILPIGSVEEARALKTRFPTYLLAGEREGRRLPDFDFGNAPSEVKGCSFGGKTVVHTTSAGTQGISNAVNADEILGCSLVNAAATARYIRQSGAHEVSLVCMGWAGVRETEEDTLCARYIESLLNGTAIDMETELLAVRHGEGTKFFDPTQQDVFPEADFYCCTAVDAFDFALKLHSDGEFSYIQKEDVYVKADIATGCEASDP